jgi:hypothetical protein
MEETSLLPCIKYSTRDYSGETIIKGFDVEIFGKDLEQCYKYLLKIKKIKEV